MNLKGRHGTMGNISEIIKRKREELHLTQEELAEKVGVSRQAVSKWELGKNFPDIYAVKRLSEVFEMDSNELIGVENIKKKGSKKAKIIWISSLLSTLVICIALFLILFFSLRKEPKQPDFTLSKTEYSYFYGVTKADIEKDILQNVEYNEEDGKIIIQGITTQVGEYIAYVSLDRDKETEKRISIEIMPNRNGLTTRVMNWEYVDSPLGYERVKYYLDISNNTGKKIIVTNAVVTMTDENKNTVLRYIGDVPNWNIEHGAHLFPTYNAVSGFNKEYFSSNPMNLAITITLIYIFV